MRFPMPFGLDSLDLKLWHQALERASRWQDAVATRLQSGGKGLGDQNVLELFEVFCRKFILKNHGLHEQGLAV